MNSNLGENHLKKPSPSIKKCEFKQKIPKCRNKKLLDKKCMQNMCDALCKMYRCVKYLDT